MELKDLASKKEEHLEKYHQINLHGKNIKEFDKRQNSQLKVEKIGSNSKVQAVVERTYRESKQRQLNEATTKTVQKKLDQIKMKEERQSKYKY